MRVVLAGDDPQLNKWRDIAISCGAEPIALSDAGHGASSDSAGLPWQAAIISGSARSVLEAAKALGKPTPVFVTPLPSDAAAIAYGLLPDVEDGRPVVPGWTTQFEPAVVEYLNRFVRGDLGDLTLLRMERTISVEGQTDAKPLISQPSRDAALLEDLPLLRLLGGDYNRVTTVAIGGHQESVRQVTVTLEADDTPEAVWSTTAGVRQQCAITLSGTRAQAQLQWCDDGPIRLVWDGSEVDLDHRSAAEEAIRSFLNRSTDPHSTGDATSPPPVWEDLVRTVDLLEGVHRSLRRRRTIDLHFESKSERSQFKTQMTAIGCGVLLWALLGTCVGLLLGSLFDPRDSTERTAAAAGTILSHEDFQSDGAELTASARERITDNVAIEGEGAIVLIERNGNCASTALDSDRLTVVQELLTAQAGEGLPPQMEVRRLSGGWFRRMMIAVWVMTFAPLLVFLGLQLLIPLTRSGTAAGRRIPLDE